MPMQPHVFSGGATGEWRIRAVRTLCGPELPAATHLSVGFSAVEGAAWTLRGTVSNLRYTTRPERDALRASQAPLARGEASRATLIPIAKTAAWWEMAQDERRALFEEVSGHTRIGMAALPAVARRLHHARDLGEPFDFLTWFEYAPAHEATFDALLAALRATPEWSYVDREIELRLERAG
ncbi:chlorite dismutase [Methylobacterium sp. Leaf466]|nr:chlorite dismutase [Methylobacterium sp. Leaf466]